MTANNDDQSGKKRPPHQFQPGQSGNPSGRSKLQLEIKAILEEAAPVAARRLIELIQSDDEDIGIKASKDVLDRVLGKARESVEVSGDGLSDLLRALVVARPPDGGEK